MPEINDGPVQSLGTTDAAHLVAITPTAFRRIPVADVETAATLAGTALQPADVGGAAYEDAEAYIRVAAYAAQIAILVAVNTEHLDRIIALEQLVGVGSIVVFEAGVFESGVFI